MEKQTVFRKVSVKDRTPNIKGWYDTSVGRCNFYDGYFDVNNRVGVEWWLEEIELPSEDEIKSESKSKGDWYDIENFIKGANYILNKLK